MQDVEIVVDGKENEDENNNDVIVAGHVDEQISHASTLAPVLKVSNFQTREERNDVSKLIFVNFK